MSGSEWSFPLVLLPMSLCRFTLQPLSTTMSTTMSTIMEQLLLSQPMDRRQSVFEIGVGWLVKTGERRKRECMGAVKRRQNPA